MLQLGVRCSLLDVECSLTTLQDFLLQQTAEVLREMRHLYLHVPFCSRRCIYCDFSIAVRREIPERRFVNAVVQEYEHRRASGEWDDERLETLYVGGGTPSLVPANSLSELVGFLLGAEGAGGAEGADLEVTLEANPENVTSANAVAWAEAGVNRVSLGVQSFDPEILEWMHRPHSPAHMFSAVRYLREAGIESLSFDLIAALPAQLRHDLSEDLSRAIDMGPAHVSVYGLTVEPRTALARWIAREKIVPATDEAYARDFLLAHEVLTGAGFEHYEVSNYAMPGQRSRHNSAYWDVSRYAGLGPSAHGFDGKERRWNVSPWAEYERLICDIGDATGGRETLTAEQTALERVYLGLRVSDGLELEELSALDPVLIARAEENGWAEVEDHRLRITAVGWLRMDEIVTALTTSPEGG